MIVGGGPAGSTLSWALAPIGESVRLRRKSRQSGDAWLANLRDQLTPFELAPEHARVETVEADNEGFRTDYRPMRGIEEEAVPPVHAKRVLVTAGKRDGPLLVPNADELTRCGLFRLCPICDRYETEGKRVAMLGLAKCALADAMLCGHSHPTFPWSRPTLTRDRAQKRIWLSPMASVG